jgi:hypothetical protein
MPRKLSGPVTLRITEAEVLESQLNPDDLSVLEAAADDGNGGGAKCGGTYCETNYTAPEVLSE